MNKESPETHHQKLSLYFHGMIAVPLAFFVYLFLEMRHNELIPIIQDLVLVKVLNYSITIVAAAVVIYVYQHFKKGVFAARELKGLRNKMKYYVRVSLRVYMYIGAIFATLVLGLRLTTSAIFIVDYVLLLFLLSLHRPTPTKYVRDLMLKGQEKDIIVFKGEFES